MGELVCPACENVMARLFDDPEGIAVLAWIPAPSAHGSRRMGWGFYTLIDASMPDDENAPLQCWRGHGPWVVTARDCRASAAVYRRTGRKKRRPLSPIDPAAVR
ncbi:hypothetical protein [Streptomyces beijiangensis]